MSEAVKWDGFPVFGRDRDAWHLLNYDMGEHPVPMWWNWRGECWSSSPDAAFGTPARDADFSGYSYCAGTVTPSDLKDAIAEAVAAERERCAKVCEGLMEPDFALPDSWFNNGCKHSAHAIRSAAK
ncbi:MAG: hypothetical protein ABF812_09875 [Gluconobacter cerinus]|uniref:hypothetical protein n=1 Tax=Gluconobacter cerinus TaxID=38307 RepID=UPI0039EB8B5A